MTAICISYIYSPYKGDNPILPKYLAEGIRMLVKIRHNEQLISANLLLVSHRGGKGFGPENTLDSLRGALKFGVEMV